MDVYSSVTYDDQLPERTHIPLLTVDEIKAILKHLRDAFNPPVRGTRVVGHQRIFPSPSDGSLESMDHLKHMQAGAKCPQPFSRKLACDWLTALISHLQRGFSKGGENIEALRQSLMRRQPYSPSSRELPPLGNSPALSLSATPHPHSSTSK